MKNTKICPKCGGVDILTIKGNAGAYGAGNNIALTWSYVLVDRYLCGSCGYSEEWVDTSAVPKLKKKYQKDRNED